MPAFECHVTVAPPISEESRETLERLAEKNHFKIAKLYKQNGELDRSDAFMTAWANDYAVMLFNMGDLLEDLKHENWPIYRYKIEKIMLDSRDKDWEPLI